MPKAPVAKHWGMKPIPSNSPRPFPAPLLLGMAKPRSGSGVQVNKAEDDAARLQPPNGGMLRKTWYCDGAEDERIRIMSLAMEMAIAKPLAFRRAKKIW